MLTAADAEHDPHAEAEPVGTAIENDAVVVLVKADVVHAGTETDVAAAHHGHAAADPLADEEAR